MAKTNWTTQDILKPDDLNKIGTELNEVRSLADAAETPLGAQSKVEAGLRNAKSYTDSQVESIPIATTNNDGLLSTTDKTVLDSATDATTPNTLVKRSANGTFKAATPAANDDVVRKAELADLSNATDENTPNRIVKRDVNGQFKVGVPIDSAHAARKEDVDSVKTLTNAHVDEIYLKIRMGTM